MSLARPLRIRSSCSRARAAWGIAAALVATSVLAACTGGGGSTTTTTVAEEATPPTSSTTSTTVPADPAQAAYVAQVNPICVERNEKIVAAAQGQTVPDTAGAVAKRARLSIEAVGEIRTIAPPPGDEEEVATLLASMDEVNRITAELAEAILYVDSEKGRAAAASLVVELPVLNEQLVAYGMADCTLDPPTG